MPCTEVDVRKLPEEIRAKLAQLDLELSEGDITEKGYEKRRHILLEPFLRKRKSTEGGGRAPTEDKAEGERTRAENAQRRRARRATRDQPRYHSEIRQEAVHQALAEWGRGESRAKHSIQSKALFQPIRRRHTSRVSCATGSERDGAKEKKDVKGETDSSSDDETNSTADSGTAGSREEKKKAKGEKEDGKERRKKEEQKESPKTAEEAKSCTSAAEPIIPLSNGKSKENEGPKASTSAERENGSLKQSVAMRRVQQGQGGGGGAPRRTNDPKAPRQKQPAAKQLSPRPMANRTSVLVLEDRPLPPLPPSTDSEGEGDAGPARAEEEGGTAVYVNSTNDSGLGGSTGEDYANTQMPAKSSRVSQKIQQVMLSLQVGRQSLEWKPGVGGKDRADRQCAQGKGTEGECPPETNRLVGTKRLAVALPTPTATPLLLLGALFVPTPHRLPPPRFLCFRPVCNTFSHLFGHRWHSGSEEQNRGTLRMDPKKSLPTTAIRP